jgi:L-ascorbate 6-phosphate lactonase
MRYSVRMVRDDRTDRVRLTWLGQAGFLIKGWDQQVLIDPFYSNHELRLYEPLIIEELPADLGWLLVTHEHGDHFDVEALPKIVQRAPGISIVVPQPMVKSVATRFPTVTVRGMQPGDRIVSGQVVITSVPAIHGIAIADGYTDGRAQTSGLTPFSGYLIDFPSLSLYHSGDTVIAGELLEFLESRKPDVVLLPVNGRDYFREEQGWLGNMNSREAVVLAGRIGASVLIPMHHDMIRGNTERPGAAADLAADLHIKLHVLNLARGLEFLL